MLSLKSTSTSQVATDKTRLVDLPSELIKSVLDHVCNLDDLLSASLVSKSLRDAILPILYGSINVTFTTRIKRNGETSLDFLSKRPHLQKHIRGVIIRPALSNVDHDRQEFSKFRRLSPGLENLCYLRICAWDSFSHSVLTLPFTRRLKILVDIGKTPTTNPVHLQSWENHQVLALSLRLWYPACLVKWPGKEAEYQPGLADVMSGIVTFTALRSLSLVIEADKLIVTKSLLQAYFMSPEADCAMPSLRELHLNVPMRPPQALYDVIIHFLEIIPWSRLHRLSLTGNALIEEVLQSFRTSLTSLHSLRLEAARWPPTYKRSNHTLANDIHNDPAEGTWPASIGVVANASLLLRDQAFEEVELEGFDMELSLAHILSDKLRKLKLHMCELQPVCARRQAAELQLLSKLAPNIEHMELDVARIGNLWHATAVPGVDVDVRIYQVLDAITALPRLKWLRLFPQYRDGGINFGGKFTQPLTDDAAVRLFRRLKEKSASLETLAISSDNHVARYIADFDPMSWELRTAGEKIVLTVRQANHDYEQRQVWVGERRLTTEIRRFSYQKPYIPEFEGWIMEC